MTLLGLDGRAGEMTLLASTYAVDVGGGCSASGARGSWLVLALFALTRIRRSPRRRS